MAAADLARVAGALSMTELDYSRIRFDKQDLSDFFGRVDSFVLSSLARIEIMTVDVENLKSEKAVMEVNTGSL